MPRKTRSKPISQEEWEKYRKEITDHFLEKTRAEMIEYLTEKYNFTPRYV